MLNAWSCFVVLQIRMCLFVVRVVRDLLLLFNNLLRLHFACSLFELLVNCVHLFSVADSAQSRKKIMQEMRCAQNARATRRKKNASKIGGEKCNNSTSPASSSIFVSLDRFSSFSNKFRFIHRIPFGFVPKRKYINLVMCYRSLMRTAESCFSLSFSLLFTFFLFFSFFSSFSLYPSAVFRIQPSLRCRYIQREC